MKQTRDPSRREFLERALSIGKAATLAKIIGPSLIGATGLAALTGLGCPTIPKDPNVKTAVLHLPCDWHSNGILTVGVWYDPNLMSSEGNPVVVSSPGYFQASPDIAYLHNSKAKQGIIVASPDPEDPYNQGSADMLNSLKSSPEYQAVVDDFGSVDNYTKTVLFAPYSDSEKSGLISMHPNVLLSVFGNVVNQLKEIPGYENANVIDFVSLLRSSINGDVEDPRVLSVLGPALYGSRCKDISFLIDALTGQNKSGYNGGNRNHLVENGLGGLKVDVERIAGEGYSAGGGTILRLLGANNNAAMGDYCFEERIKCAVLYAPAAGLNYPEAFSAVDRNLLWITADKDPLTKSSLGRQPLTPKNIGKEFLTLLNSGHGTISGTECYSIIAAIRRVLPQTAEEWGACDNHDEVARAAMTYSELFYQRELGLKSKSSGKQTDLVTAAHSDPEIYFATDKGVTPEDIQNYFPQYVGQI